MVLPVVMYGCESWLWRRLSTEELMLLNWGVGEDSWESPGLQGDSTSPFWRRSALGFLWKEWCWSSSTLATSCEELTHWKRPWCWEDWGQEEKGTTEGEMAGWHHWLDGREFEWTLGVGDGRGGLVCCDSWGRKESNMTEWLNWTDISFTSNFLTWKEVECFPIQIFLHLYRWLNNFYLSFLLVCIHIDLQRLNDPCIAGINPTWSWYIILIMFCWFPFAKFVENFYIYVHQRYWLVIFFSYSVFDWLWYQGNADFVKWVLVAPLFSLFSFSRKCMRRFAINYSLNFVTISLTKSIMCSWAFLC